eukprot:gene12837-biopygen9050
MLSLATYSGTSGIVGAEDCCGGIVGAQVGPDGIAWRNNAAAAKLSLATLVRLKAPAAKVYRRTKQCLWLWWNSGAAKPGGMAATLVAFITLMVMQQHRWPWQQDSSGGGVARAIQVSQLQSLSHSPVLCGLSLASFL